MPTDRVSPPNRLAGVMRALAQGKTSASGRAVASTPLESTNGPELPSHSTHAIDALRQRLRSLVAHVNLDEAASLLAIREPVLREILLWEFGSDFRKDSQFLPMVDALAKSLDAVPGFQDQFVGFVAGLQS
jgi:hypothetical protein